MKTVLFIGLVFPEPNSSAAGTRILQLITLFKNQGYKVIFASSAQKSEYSFDLASIDVTAIAIELNNSSFDIFLKSIQPDLVVFDRFISEEQFGWRVAQTCPDAIRILDTEDLHCLRYARQQALKKNNSFSLQNLLTEPSTFREIASIFRCDLTLMISEFEINILKNLFKIEEQYLSYLPLFYQKKQHVKGFEERKNFIFIGNFIHEPNYDAVLQLKTFWKEIKKQLPDSSLNIYGAYPSQKVLQLHNEKEGFLIKGRADNALTEIEKARVLLAPLRFGAGIKGKLLEAMVTGTPSITTTIGQEGISNGIWNGYIENDLKEIPKKAVMLYTDENLWKSSQQIGYQILDTRFNIAYYENDFFKHLETLFENLEVHRKNNFIGNLLYLNQFASTKYLSKWIEEKNRL